MIERYNRSRKASYPNLNSGTQFATNFYYHRRPHLLRQPRVLPHPSEDVHAPALQPEASRPRNPIRLKSNLTQLLKRLKVPRPLPIRCPSKKRRRRNGNLTRSLKRINRRRRKIRRGNSCNDSVLTAFIVLATC